jgi:hypothetical protein
MSKMPKVPKEQRAFSGEKAELDGEPVDRRDNRTDVRDGQPGDAGVNTAEQGRFGNIAQNTTHQGNVQDR